VQPTGAKAARSGAYDAYLRGRELIRLRNLESLQESVRHLEHSLRLDNDFAPAHAQLAIATAMLQQSTLAYGKLSLEEVRRKAVPHLDRAQALEPDLAEAHGGRALLALLTSDLESTIRHARKALASNPSDIDAMNWMYVALVALSRYEEAEAALEQVLATDPLTIVGRVNYIGWLCSIGQIREVHEMADQLGFQSPASGFLAHADASLIYEGKISEGLSWALRAPPGNFYATYAFIWVGEYDEARRVDEDQTYWVDLAEGRFDEAYRAMQRNMQLDPENGEFIASAADVLYLAGRSDEALPLYERALDFTREGRPISGPLSNARTIWLASARRKAGDEDGARAAAQIARRDVAARRAAGRRNQELRHTEAMLAAFERNADAVVAALKSAVQLGLRNPQIFDDPIFEEVRDAPGFAALQLELDAILATERDKVLQMICFNNPVPDDWQPMPATCAGVADRRGH
jgi:tetratricopeptide (TPR) repeat protein